MAPLESEPRLAESDARAAPAPAVHADPRNLAAILGWILSAAVAFHAAYAWKNGGPFAVIYLFAMVQLAQVKSWRKAYYCGLAVGFLIAILQLAFFWKIFSGGAVALWYVYAFWLGLFVATAGACLRRLHSRWAWLLVPFIW